MSTSSSSETAGRGVSPPRYFAAVLVLYGALLGAGGIALSALGGSPYYAIAGALLIACGVLLWRGRRSGAMLYGLFMAGTLAWSLWEVGFDGWALLPRLSMPAILGVWLLVTIARRSLK